MRRLRHNSCPGGSTHGRHDTSSGHPSQRVAGKDWRAVTAGPRRPLHRTPPEENTRQMSTGHTAKVMNRAQELRAAGWSLRRISVFLEPEVGHRISHTTLMRWTDPHQAELQRERVHVANRRALNARITGRMPAAGNLTSDFKLIRVRALDQLGLSPNAIASVMSFDFPASPVTGRQVTHALSVGRWPTRCVIKEAA